MDENVKSKKETSFKERTGSVIFFAILATGFILFVIFGGTRYDYEAVGEEITGYVFFVTYRHTSWRPGAARIPYIIVRDRVPQEAYTHRITFPAPIIRDRQTLTEQSEAVLALRGQEITIRYYPNSTNSTVWIDPPHPPYGVQLSSYPHDYDAEYIEITGQKSGMGVDWEAEPPTWTFGIRETVQEARFDRHEIRYPGTLNAARRLANTYVTIMYYPGGENAPRLISSENSLSYPLPGERDEGFMRVLWGALAVVWVLAIILIATDYFKRRRRENESK